MEPILVASITLLATFLFLAFVATIIFVFWYKNNKEYPNRMCLRIHNGGKALVFHDVKWKYQNSKKFGEIILAKVRGKIIPMPRFENRYSLPLSGSRGLFIDVTAKDGYFYINEIKNLQKTLGTEKIKELLREKYELMSYDAEPFAYMINPIAHEDRSAILMSQNQLNEMEKENTPWWQNPFVAFLAPAFIGCIVAIVLAALGYQFGTNLVGAAQPAAEAAGGTIADTIANTIGGGAPPQ